jgi:hypothetical protein
MSPKYYETCLNPVRVKSLRKPSEYQKETMSAPSAPSAAPAAASTAIATEIGLPNEKTLKHASRIAIEQDKPIMLDYYVDTRDGKAFLGEDSTTKEKMLVRSEEEYTSLIQKIFKVADDFIVIRENSIYIVSGATKKKTISAPSS